MGFYFKIQFKTNDGYSGHRKVYSKDREGAKEIVRGIIAREKKIKIEDVEVSDSEVLPDV